MITSEPPSPRGDVRRASRVEQIFLALWQQLGYAERLSDFEYMLATLLVESTPADATITSQSPIVTKMRLLGSASTLCLPCL
jgi:hypothetical protein